MNARPIAVALMLVFAPASVSLPRVAHAQGTQDDAITKAARARFQEGVEAFDKGNFEAARASFKQAYALKQHPAVLLNLAQSSLKSGHFLESAKMFQQYLADPQGDKKADAQHGLTDARAKLGRLDVTAPPGSEVTVDTDVVGKTPMNEAVDVEAGNHTVRTRLPDGTTSEQKIAVTAGQILPVRFGAAATVVTQPTNPNPPVVHTEPVLSTNPLIVQQQQQQQQTVIVNTNPPEHVEKVRPVAALALIIAGGAVTVGGFILAGIFAAEKGTANANYMTVNNNIIDAEKAAHINPQTCNPPPNGYASACSTLQSNAANVNQDATVANVGVALGIIGLAATVGGVIWYFAGAKAKEPSSTSITPWMAPGFGGVSLRTTF
jgi:hypothetical protein